MDSITACGSCGAGTSEQMKFCPGCGRRLLKRTKGFVISGLASALVLFGVAFGLQILAREGRVKPAAHPVGAAEERAEASTVTESPQLAAMRREVERSPEDLTKLKVFAGMLGDVLRSNPEASPQLVFEAIDVFGRILQKEPNDPAALVMMADVSFDQKAFTKALDFYERYLALQPDDLGARSRYASTLTFLGRYDDSVAELGKVLAREPENFPAMAYLAITYAQKGEILKAKAIGTDALRVAPSEDARARFSSFVSSLDPSTAGAQSQQAPSAQPAAAPVDASPAVSSFIKVVASNPVAGPKFAGYAQPAESTLQLKFNNFPMAQMPPFAKQKFFTGLKEALAQSNLSQIEQLEFVDAGSGEVMERLKIRR
jgi:tetratricopeptide (TPR) repeat protein